MPIIVKKEKKKINYFFYLSLLAFLLAVVWFIYHEWSHWEKATSNQVGTENTFDVTHGLADIKVEEGQKIVDNPAYKRLSQYSQLPKPLVVGKSNPFSE